ncbi:MAG: pyrroline-5-carboxylate reductase, partial [Bryobacteraceae bacterium]|nr:pyrroline-5-carboxylate reductase [Bryobacteraceae bacterium]
NSASVDMKRIAVLGAGNIGAAMIGGILKSGLADRDHLIATEASAERAEQIADRFGIPVRLRANREAASWADVVLIAVKPPTVPQVLEEIREALRSEHILVSLAAAVPIALIEKLVGKRLAIFRAMPNIPVVVDEGATAVAANGAVTLEQRRLVEEIFAAVGYVVFVEEELMHAVTALSGSGPAYIYMVIEALIDGGLKMGLSREVATRLTEQTVLGAAKLVRETGLHPAILKDQVITPGGVTISAIHELEKHGLRSMLISAIETATLQSRRLTESLTGKVLGRTQ